MKQTLNQSHMLDQNGNPAGGTTLGKGIEIRWQNGPLGRGEHREEPNGAFVEGVIQAALDRLQFYQSSKFKCRENELASSNLREALRWLQQRTENREARGTEGTHEI